MLKAKQLKCFTMNADFFKIGWKKKKNVHKQNTRIARISRDQKFRECIVSVPFERSELPLQHKFREQLK